MVAPAHTGGTTCLGPLSVVLGMHRESVSAEPKDRRGRGCYIGGHCRPHYFLAHLDIEPPPQSMSAGRVWVCAFSFEYSWRNWNAQVVSDPNIFTYESKLCFRSRFYPPHMYTKCRSSSTTLHPDPRTDTAEPPLSGCA